MTDARQSPSPDRIPPANGGNSIEAGNAVSDVSDGKRPVSGRLVAAVVALAILTFLGILSETSLNIAYSVLMGEFAISADVVQWLTTGYLLLLSVAIPVSPFMVRRFAARTLFAAAVAIFTVGTLIGALAASFPMLLAARLVMALGTGISLPLITTIILEKAPLERRGMMLGIVSLVTCAAPAIGPVFGGVVMEYLNWHWIFYAMLPFLAVSLALGLATVPEIRHGDGVREGHGGDARAASISVPSLLLVAAGLSALIVAVSFFAAWHCDWRFWGMLAFAVAALALFAALQLRMERPLVQVRVFAYPGFSLGMLILLMASGSALGLNFLLPILLQRGFGLGSLDAALVLLPGAVVGAVSAPVIGGLLRSHFPPKFIIIGFAATTLADAVFAFAGGGVWTVAVTYAAFMAFSGFVLVPDQTHALNQLPARLNADGSAVMNTVQQLAGAIGTAVASTLIAEFSAEAPYAQAFGESVRVFMGLAVAGVALAALMFRFSVRRPPEPERVDVPAAR
ncbi:lincomycin resistance protein LmrB [Bifidobacterium sp. DSM 109958]|uniref:Lincomycin resistance protein LmrB n=1 Tax=Bifidobacterium moraviense TaxID=2675323 RepID=A0A7Y0F3G9_9BIFI|nr:DHA2 family efflux MFS transporter permease subunit [Bifidobacterium sp. DSM 109958]NMN01204.1 lincomycin resistance protein LmrB [Bifidobacterium sp. DSM 109958]